MKYEIWINKKRRYAVIRYITGMAIPLYILFKYEHTGNSYLASIYSKFTKSHLPASHNDSVCGGSHLFVIVTHFLVDSVFVL